MSKLIAYNKDILEWDTFPEYDILYTDPPWEQRMVNFFQTMKKKQTGVKTTHTIFELLSHLAIKANKMKPMFIEYSEIGSQNVIDIMQYHGHNCCQKVNSIQSNGKPYVILSFNNNFELPSLKGDKSIRAVVKGLQPKIVFDPFAGIGFTARAVLQSGANYIGSEFNEARYNKLKMYENI